MLAQLSYLVNIVLIKILITMAMVSMDERNVALVIIERFDTVAVDAITFAAMMAVLQITIRKAFYMKWRVFATGSLVVFGTQFQFWKHLDFQEMNPTNISAGFAAFELLVLVMTYRANARKYSKLSGDKKSSGDKIKKTSKDDGKSSGDKTGDSA